MATLRFWLRDLDTGTKHTYIYLLSSVGCDAPAGYTYHSMIDTRISATSYCLPNPSIASDGAWKLASRRVYLFLSSQDPMAGWLNMVNLGEEARPEPAGGLMTSRLAREI
ncbi:hypothetical protein TWF706_003255 [Orbilia oligospora]|nr:hypothetical protein TWF706_003255 [Orbilia oligospora]